MTADMTADMTAETYAGFWIRVWASFIDSILLAILVGPLVYAIYGRAYLDTEKLIAGPADFLLTWVFPAVAVILFWIYRGATPGKMATHLLVVDARSGKAMTSAQCIGRYLGYYVSLLPFAAGFVWIAFDARKQGFHDKLAGTVVIRRNAIVSDENPR